MTMTVAVVSEAALLAGGRANVAAEGYGECGL